MTPEDVLQEIEKRVETDHIPFVEPEKGKDLTSAIHAHNPKRILEIGTNVGYSTILMASVFGESTFDLVFLDGVKEDYLDYARAGRKFASETKHFGHDAVEVAVLVREE